MWKCPLLRGKKKTFGEILFNCKHLFYQCNFICPSTWITCLVSVVFFNINSNYTFWCTVRQRKNLNLVVDQLYLVVGSMRSFLCFVLILTLIFEIDGQRNLYRSNRRRTHQDIDREESLVSAKKNFIRYLITYFCLLKCFRKTLLNFSIFLEYKNPRTYYI